MANKSTPLKTRALFDKVSKELRADVLFYNAPIERHFDQRVIELCNSIRRREQVALILITEGGDADAAYRIASCLQQKYSKFTLLVPGYCKSAGTLVSLGAHEIALSDQGELGPLDVQLVRKDELFTTQSGLTATSALSALHEHAFKAFEEFMLQIKFRSGDTVTTKMAMEIAANMTSGLFTSVYQQIDPMHVGEAERALEIATQYGRRLSGEGGNLISDSTLNHLVSHYPSHGFIIDLAEAKNIFKNVRRFTEAETDLVALFGSRGRWPAFGEDDVVIDFLSSERRATRKRRKAAPRKEVPNVGQEEPRSATGSGQGAGEDSGAKRTPQSGIRRIGGARKTP
jgi:hypothetical protein